MWLCRAVIRVNLDAAAVIGFNPRRRQIQRSDVPLPSYGVQQRVANDALLAHQICRRFSTMMTRTPSVANMHAYSTPITPPPTTISVFGICDMLRIWSLLMMFRPLMGTLEFTDGLVPVAMTT